MPLVAAAVCPHPPLLVPEIAAGAAAELDDLRTACRAAVAGLDQARPDTLVVVGSGTDTGPVDPPYQASFAPWGVPASLGGPGRQLPLSLAVAVWLLAGASPRHEAAAPAGVPLAAGAAAPTLYAVRPDTPPGDCAALGERLAGVAGRVALLVMGDGSACQGIGSPGSDDPRAGSYNRDVARALGTVDTGALLSLDPALAERLRVAGRAPWQVLAGAVRATGGDWRGELLYDAAPYGVAYFVAGWRPA